MSMSTDQSPTLDEALDETIKALTNKVIDSAINIDAGIMTLAEGQKYALDAQAQAHRRLKALVLTERLTEVRDMPIQLHAEHAIHKEHCITVRYRNARLRTLQAELAGVEAGEDKK